MTPNLRFKGSAAIALALMVGVTAFWLAQNRTYIPQPNEAVTATTAPLPEASSDTESEPEAPTELASNLDPQAEPLSTVEDALSLTDLWFRNEISSTVPYTTVVRLVSLSTIRTWTNSSSDADNPAAPVWLIGCVYDKLITDPEEAANSYYKPCTRFQGAYIAWNANGGWPVVSGVLCEQWDSSLASLSALANENIAISQATIRPPVTGETAAP